MAHKPFILVTNFLEQAIMGSNDKFVVCDPETCVITELVKRFSEFFSKGGYAHGNPMLESPLLCSVLCCPSAHVLE